MAVNVLVVDDQELMRSGISSLLRRCDFECDVVGQAPDGEQAVQMVSEHHPDIVILDVSLPTMSGIEATRAIRAIDPAVKVLAVSAYTDQAVIAEIVRAGAAGYILKDVLFEELGEGIKTLQQGKPFYSACIADKVPPRIHLTRNGRDFAGCLGISLLSIFSDRMSGPSSF